MVKITGEAKVRRRLRGLISAAAERRVGAALFAGGHLIQTEAQLSITRGAVSGKGHVPSAPGEPPNQDSGVLANNIETAQTGPLKVEVSSNAPYAAVQEFGSSKQAERPYMRPAAAAKRKEVARLVAKALGQGAR